MEEIRLKDICDLDNGYAFKSDDYVESSNTLNCRMSNIRPDGSFDILYSAKYLPDEFVKKYKNYVLNDGDLIIAMTDMAGDPKILGVPTVVDTKGYKLLLNQRVGRLRFIRDGINADYLKFALQCKRVRDYLKMFAGGGVQLNVSKKDILNAPIRMRAIGEQQSIADLLKRIIKLQKLLEQELQHFDNLIKARFVEMFGALNNTSYKTLPLGDVCEFIKDGTHQTPTYTEDKVRGFKFLSSKDVTSQKISWSNIKYIPESLHNELYSKLAPKRGDILLAKNGTTGVAAVVDTDEVFDIYVSLALLRPKLGYNSQYLWAVINSNDTKMQFNANLKGIGVPNLHLGEIKKAKVIVPPLEQQTKFADFLEQIDKSKFNVNCRNLYSLCIRKVRGTLWP